MAHSSLLGSDPVPRTPSGRDTEALGPSDTSDSGSDVAGLADEDDGDPGLPADIAADPDSERSATSYEAIGDGSNTDSTGTGERSAAADDAPARDGADIAPDRVVFDPNSGADAEGVLDDVTDAAPRPEGGVDALLYASASEAGDDEDDLDALDDTATLDAEHAAKVDDADDASGLRRRAARVAGSGGEDDGGEVEPHAPGGTHPKAAAPRGARPRASTPGGTQPKKPHSPRRERDHGLSGPDPDVPAPTPHPDEGGNDEGVNDEGDDTLVVPKK